MTPLSSNPLFTQLLTVLAALIAALVAYLLGSTLSKSARSPAARLEQLTEVEAPAAAVPGSQLHRERVFFARFGVRAEGRERLFTNALRWGLPVLVLAITLLIHLPPLVAIALAAIAFFAAGSLIDNAWASWQSQLEEQLPAFLSAVSSTLQITQDVVQAVDQESDALPAGSPLREWLRERFLPAARAQGLRAMDGLQQEAYSISTALGVTVFLLGRVWRTGGPQWAAAFDQAKDNLRGVLSARGAARAAASAANSSVLIIIGMSLVVMLFMLLNPGVATTMRTGTTQLIYVGCLALMAFGYSFIHNMVQDML